MACVLDAIGARGAQQLLGPRSGMPGARGGCTERRRVTVVREVPHVREFILDDDNLEYSLKPLLDGIKQAGLIRDDRRKWIDRPPVDQRVSADGYHWTRITIEAIG